MIVIKPKEKPRCPECGSPYVTIKSEWITCSICGHDDMI